MTQAFAQLLEKPSLQEKAAKFNENKTKDEDRSLIPKEYECAINHVNLEDINLKEESNSKFLKKMK